MSRTAPESFQPLDPGAVRQSDVSFVLLPRLKLGFSVRTVDGMTRLFSLDHSDFYITNARTDTAVELLKGIPQSLLLSNANGELQVLVSSFPPARPLISTRPFSTELVLLREDAKWRKALDQPYFMYPVHISLSFLYSTTLASALYLLLLRFLNRDYEKVALLVDTISSDVQLSEEENQTLQFLSSEKNSPDMHPDAHACRLKISLVLLDSPISVPWDLTCEMQRYITKLMHVSASCRLSHEEELMLLKHCVCDACDAKFSAKIHSVYRVLVVKNRRSWLRATAAGKDECSVEVPPTPMSHPWIYQWDDHGLDISEPGLHALIENCDLARAYKHQRTMDGLEGMIAVFNAINQAAKLPAATAALALQNGFFLFLYDLFSGHTSLKLLSNDCAETFAIMCLPLLPDVYRGLGAAGDHEKDRSLMSSVLLTLARKPGLGKFLPRLSLSGSKNRAQKNEDNTNNDAKVLLRSVLHDLHELSRHDESSMKRLLSRRVDVETKSNMFGYGCGKGGGGFGGGFGGKGMFGGFGYSQTYAQLEQMAKDTENKLDVELNSMVDWPELKSLAEKSFTAAALPPLSGQGTFGLRSLGMQDERWVLPRVSDHSCDKRGLCMVDDSVLTNAPHLHVTPHELEAFATAPLSVLGLEDWVTQVPKTGDKVDGKLGFDVQSHPDAQSKVAQDMHLRLVRDMKEYADSTNCSLVTLLNFLQAPHEMLARDEQHTHTYTKTSALTETSLQLDKLVRYNLSKRAVAVCCRVLQGVAGCCSVL